MKSLVTAALAVCSIGAAGAASAWTYTWYYTDYAYFSDSTRTTVVGGTTTFCNRRVESWGTQTAYKRLLERYDCNQPIP